MQSVNDFGSSVDLLLQPTTSPSVLVHPDYLAKPLVLKKVKKKIGRIASYFPGGEVKGG